MPSLLLLVVIGIIPALFSAAVWQIFHDLPPADKLRRWVVGLMLVLVVTIALFGLSFQPGATGYIMTPAAITLVALTCQQLWLMPGWQPWMRAAVQGMVVVILVLLVAFAGGVPAIVLGSGVVLFSVWELARLPAGRLAALVISAAGMWALGGTNLLYGFQEPLPPAVEVIISAFLFYTPGWVMAFSAVLFTLAIQSLTINAAPQPVVRRIGQSLVSALTAISLVACFSFLVYWISVWDQTSDSLGGSILSLIAGLSAVAAGMFSVHENRSIKPAWRWVSGLGFALFVALSIIFVTQQGHAVNYQQATHENAGKIAAALEKYRQQRGQYPDDLTELVPFQLTILPKPILIKGEGWCYQAWQSQAGQSFALGALYREWFNSPVEIRIYASRGSPTSDEWACTDQLAAYQNRHQPGP